MTDSSAPNSSLETAQLNTVTNVSGGVNLDAGRVDVSGDVVGRDKVQSAGRDMLNVASGATVNNYYYASTSAISTGLSALSELMQRLPEVRRDVLVFQDVLGAAHVQIDLLRDYKDLHDLLHHLQFQFYDDILQEAPRFPADEITVEKFVRYQLNFTDFVTALRGVAQRPTLPQEEISWVEDVAAAQVDLAMAVDNLDGERLKPVIKCFKRVLNMYPSRINTLLSHTARVLRLQALVEALARICDSAAANQLQDDNVQKLQAGVKDLRQFDQDLLALVEEHDRWQKIDLELHCVDATLGHDLSDLVDSWLEIKARAEPLYVKVVDKWAQNLQTESGKLTAALAAGNPPKVKSIFRSYQHQVSAQFFRVDVNLKLACGELSKIGEPLDRVLRETQ